VKSVDNNTRIANLLDCLLFIIAFLKLYILPIHANALRAALIIHSPSSIFTYSFLIFARGTGLSLSQQHFYILSIIARLQRGEGV
jgi:membrane protein YqaA with SNARE-associated domain